MRAKSASFLTSAAELRGFPEQTVPEIAIAGRSNVGKSSLINRLVGVHRLAKTSSTPGRTRLLNWFEIVTPGGTKCAFVDLPGYGYAKVSKSMRKGWGKLVEDYLSTRQVLQLVVLLVDIRRGANEEEHELLDWLRENGIPFLLVLTKGDKFSKAKRFPEVAKINKAFGGVKAILTSVESGDGIDELWKSIDRALPDVSESAD